MFERKEFDDKVTQLFESAKNGGASSEALYLIDSSLREFVVAINDMRSQGADPGDLCDASVAVNSSMVLHVASLVHLTSHADFVQFINKYLFELSQCVSEVIKKTDPDGKHAEYNIVPINPSGTQH